MGTAPSARFVSLSGTTWLKDGSMSGGTKWRTACHEPVKEVIHEQRLRRFGSGALIETCLATTANFITWCRRTLSGSSGAALNSRGPDNGAGRSGGGPDGSVTGRRWEEKQKPPPFKWEGEKKKSDGVFFFICIIS